MLGISLAQTFSFYFRLASFIWKLDLDYYIDQRRYSNKKICHIFPLYVYHFESLTRRVCDTAIAHTPSTHTWFDEYFNVVAYPCFSLCYAINISHRENGIFLLFTDALIQALEKVFAAIFYSRYKKEKMWNADNSSTWWDLCKHFSSTTVACIR